MIALSLLEFTACIVGAALVGMVLGFYLKKVEK
jgi:hypothetical protein